MEATGGHGHDGRVKRAVALAALALAVPRQARPCAPAPPPEVEVAVVEEEALIVWDPAARQQHFVRRARFDTGAESFGFLVPSPSVPELAAVDDALFEALAVAIEPETVVQSGPRFFPFSLVLAPFTMFLGRSAEKSIAGAPRVAVLKTQRVGGYDAVVLAADDPAALADWLDERGFAKTDDLQAWLAAYVEKKWKLTAFTIAKNADGSSVATSAVRMTFATDEPFYPYREPASQRSESMEGPRLLRVFLVAPEPMRGMLAGKAWPGETVYRAPHGLDEVAEVKVAANAWLHAWMDRSAPRNGVDDVFFAPHRDAPIVKPPPNIVDDRTTIPIPVDVLLLIGLFVWWRRRKRSK